MLNPLSPKKRKFRHQPPRPLLTVTRTRRHIRLGRSGRPVELHEHSTRVEVSLPSFAAGARAWLVEKISLLKIGLTFTRAAVGGLA